MGKKQSRAETFFDWIQDDGADDDGAEERPGGPQRREAPRLAPADLVPLDEDEDLKSALRRRPSPAESGGTETMDRIAGLDDLPPPEPVRGARFDESTSIGDDTMDRLSMLDQSTKTRSVPLDVEAIAPLRPLEERTDGADLLHLDESGPQPEGVETMRQRTRPLEHSAQSEAVSGSDAAKTIDEPPPPGLERAGASPGTWEQQKRYERLVALVQENPEHADARIRLGGVCQELGLLKEALEHFRHALSLEPDNAFVRMKLAELGHDEGSAARPAAAPHEAIAEALRYPLSGRTGVNILAGGSLLVACAAAAIELNPLFGWPAVALFAAVLLAYLQEVLTTTLRGGSSPPSWPEGGRASDGFKRAAGALAACFLLPLLVAGLAITFAPRGLELFLPPTPDDPMSASYQRYHDQLTRYFVEADKVSPPAAEELARRELQAMGLTKPREDALSVEDLGATGLGVLGLAGVLALFGAFYFPMALLITHRFDSARPAFNYLFGVPQVVRLLPAYAAAGGLSLGLFVGTPLIVLFVGGGVRSALGLPIVGGFVQGLLGAAIGLHLAMAVPYLIGRLFPRVEHQLGWFRRG